MTEYQDVNVRLLVDLANIKPDEKGALRKFRKRYALNLDFADYAFRDWLHNVGDSPDQRILFLRGLAHRLWSGGDKDGIDLLHELLFPKGKVELHIDWRHQRLTYEPHTRLQAAFYALLMGNHLAKRCANADCVRPFFIGKRVDERYCSDKCKEVGRLATKRDWWNEHRAKKGKTR